MNKFKSASVAALFLLSFAAHAEDQDKSLWESAFPGPTPLENRVLGGTVGAAEMALGGFYMPIWGSQNESLTKETLARFHEDAGIDNKAFQNLRKANPEKVESLDKLARKFELTHIEAKGSLSSAQKAEQAALDLWARTNAAESKAVSELYWAEASKLRGLPKPERLALKPTPEVEKALAKGASNAKLLNYGFKAAGAVMLWDGGRRVYNALTESDVGFVPAISSSSSIHPKAPAPVKPASEAVVAGAHTSMDSE